MAYVYRHIRHDKNEPFYIGVGNDNKGHYSRAYDPPHRRKSSVIWNRIVSKTSYEVEILVDNIDWDAALIKEKEFIKIYGRINTQTGILANMTDGGQGVVGRIFSEEARKKYGASWRGKKMSPESNKKRSIKLRGRIIAPETRAKMSKAHKGRKVSEEMKIHLSKMNTGKKASPEAIAKMIKTKSQREYVYVGRKKSQEEIEKLRKHLWGHKRCLGYKHTPESCENMRKACKIMKAVLQYSINGEFIAEYPSQKEAMRKTGIAKEAIGKACKGYRGYKNHICKGFIWAYKNNQK